MSSEKLIERITEWLKDARRDKLELIYCFVKALLN